METQQEPLTEKMQTLNVKPATKKQFRDIKWILQQEINKPNMTDDEMIVFVFSDLHKKTDEKYGKIWFFKVGNGKKET